MSMNEDEQVQQLEKNLIENTNPGRGPVHISEFQWVTLLGQGRFGRVLLVKEKKIDLLMVLKIIDKDQIRKDGLIKQTGLELEFHSKAKHENIIKMYTFFYDEDFLYIVMEYASKGSLYQLMQNQKYGNFPEGTVAKYIYQTASALNFCHNKGFLHGDIKPENILIDLYDTVKITDFGYAWPLNSSIPRSYGGTLEYLAPELINKQPYNEKVDNWSLGILTYELLVGRNPFDCKKEETIIKRILEVDIRFPKFISGGPENLILRLATFDPMERLSLESVLSHFWIQRNYVPTYNNEM